MAADHIIEFQSGGEWRWGEELDIELYMFDKDFR